MVPTSFHGSRTLLLIMVALVLVFGVTISAIQLKNSSELSFCKRVNSIVKAEIEQSNRNEILGIGDEK